MSSASSVSGINSLQYTWQAASQLASQQNGIDPEQEAIQGAHGGGHHHGGGVNQNARIGSPSASNSDAKARGTSNATASQQTTNQPFADLRRLSVSDDETNSRMDSSDSGGDGQQDQLASEIKSDNEEDSDGSRPRIDNGHLFDITV